MNTFALSGLSVGISCLLLSGIALLFGKSKLHRILLYFNIACALWGFGLFLVGLAVNEAQAILGWQIAHLGGVFIGPVFYHMVSVFSGTRNGKLLFGGYLQAIFFTVLSFGYKHVFYEIRPVTDLFYNKATPLYALASIMYLFFVLLSYRKLIQFKKTTKGHKRTQSSYIMYGFLIGFAGGTSTFLPMFHINILYQFGNFGIVLYSVILSYAILRHRIMDFSLAVRRSLVYSISISILTAVYVALVLIMTRYLAEYLGVTSFTIMVISALIIAVLFAPLKNGVQVFVDKVFYKTSYDYYATVQKISHEFASTIELTRVHGLIVDTLFASLKPRGTHLISLKNEIPEMAYERSAQESTSFGSNDVKDEQAALRASLYEAADKIRRLKGNMAEGKVISITDDLAPFEGAVAMPIFIENYLAYILFLEKKLSGDGYSEADINLIATIANQSAIALKNARLYNELEHRVDEMMSRLMVVKKLESIGILAGGIAHDFNNIMTGILMNISLVKNDIEFENQAYRRLTNAEQGCLTAKNLTAKLITFSEGGMPVKQLASVQETIQEAAKSSLNSPAVRHEYFFPDDLRQVEFDRDQISHVIRNIVLNAQEAMPQGGVITISAENVLLDNASNSISVHNGEYIKISIKDRGIGIPKENLEKIFDPYFTTKPMGAEKGRGLGLAICHSIIRQHNGHISVESEEGRGTSFHVYLPGGVKG